MTLSRRCARCCRPWTAWGSCSSKITQSPISRSIATRLSCSPSPWENSMARMSAIPKDNTSSTWFPGRRSKEPSTTIWKRRRMHQQSSLLMATPIRFTTKSDSSSRTTEMLLCHLQSHSKSSSKCMLTRMRTQKTSNKITKSSSNSRRQLPEQEWLSKMQTLMMWMVTLNMLSEGQRTSTQTLILRWPDMLHPVRSMFLMLSEEDYND